jgi:hypothetical protein
MAVVFARGGPAIGSRSRFMKTPDTFRTDIQRTGYKKKTPSGELSKTPGDTKSEKPVKPQK